MTLPDSTAPWPYRQPGTLAPGGAGGRARGTEVSADVPPGTSKTCRTVRLPSMLQRAIVIAIGAPLFIAIVVWPGGWPFAVTIAALTLMALSEFYRASRSTGAAPAARFGYAASLALWVSAVPLLDPPGGAPAGPFLPGPRSATLFFLGLTACIAGSLIAELPRRDRAPLRNLGPTWFGVVYIGWLFSFVA